MSRTLAIAVFTAAFGIAGCASTASTESQPTASAKAPAEEEIVTGSRLPRKATGHQKAMSKEDWKLETNRGIGNAPRGN